MTHFELQKLKTDDERLKHLHEVSYLDWPIVAQWAEETNDSKNKKTFLHVAKQLYRIDEYHTYGEN